MDFRSTASQELLNLTGNVDLTQKYTWSYSGINLFKQCPLKYYRLKVLKDIVEPVQDHLLYGTAVHKAAEDYVRDGTPVPAKYGFVKEQLDALIKIKGDKYCEYEMGLDKNLQACGFKADNAWWRGIADLIIIDGEKCFLVDYKTSKSSKYADTEQLELLSLAIFKHFPNVKKIKAGLLFVVANDFVTREYINDEGKGKAWVKWLDITHTLETCMSVNVWNAKPNFTCRNFCPVTDCIHNGKHH
jgi:hypothetical protein